MAVDSTPWLSFWEFGFPYFQPGFSGKAVIPANRCYGNGSPRRDNRAWHSFVLAAQPCLICIFSLHDETELLLPAVQQVGLGYHAFYQFIHAAPHFGNVDQRKSAQDLDRDWTLGISLKTRDQRKCCAGPALKRSQSKRASFSHVQGSE